MKNFIYILTLFATTTWSEDIKITVGDCGPLARGELGVVFSLTPHGSGKGYFAKGKATEVCPNLVNAEYVIGYEEDYCKNHEPVDPRECGKIKVFVIKEYVFE